MATIVTRAGKGSPLTNAEVDGNFTNLNTELATKLTGITSGQVTTALGFTPYNATNPSGYTANTGTVTSVSGTGTVSGLTLTGSVTGAGSLTLGGAITGFLPLTGGTMTGDIGIAAGNKLAYSATAYITPENNVTGAEISTSGAITFKAGSGTPERLRIGADGLVGIGTASPASKLDVVTGVVGQILTFRGGGMAFGFASGVLAGANALELTTAGASGVQATRMIFRGSVDAADIEFYRGARGSETISMFIEGDNGNVGLGTITPSAKLETYQTSGGTNAVRMNTNFASGNYVDLNPSISGVSNGGYSISLNGTIRQVISYTGDVGFGTTAPVSKLHVSANAGALPPTTSAEQLFTVSGADGASARVLIDSFGGNAGIHMRRANGTAVAPTASLANGYLGFISAWGYGTTAYGGGSQVRIGLMASENWTDTARGTHIVFDTTLNGSTALTERMRIDNNGSVTASVDVRAPIFYDSANTGFYTDPASTSNLNFLTVGGGSVLRADYTTRFQSPSDFVDGTLVTTDIVATGFSGDSFVIEITGKTYDQNNPPVKVIAQGYLYNNQIINYSGISYAGNFASYVKVFEEGGVLKFWWPRISYWNSFNVNVMSMDGQTNGTITRNRVTAIGNAVEPTGTKKQQINLITFLRSTGNAATATKATNLNQARYGNTDFNTLGSTGQFFRAYTNYIPSGGSYNQPPNGSGDYKVIQWGDVEGGDGATAGNWGGQIVQNFYTDQMWFRRSYATTWQAWREFIHDGNYTSFAMPIGASATNTVDVRAPIFYDSNNTARYLDPASTSVVNTIEAYGGSGFRSFAAGSASVVSHLYFGDAGNTRAWNWQLDENNRAALWGYNGSAWAKTLSVATSAAGVFLRNASGTDILAFSTSIFGYSSAYRTLILGDQASTTVCIGVDPVANPSGSFTGTGSGVEVMFKNGAYFISPNSSNTTYNQYLRLVDGYVQFTNSARAPIFYDSNNTGYYVDPASNSQLNIVSLGAGSKLHLVSLADGNHFLRYANTGFSGVVTDGPQLAGHQGGELATNLGGDNWSLRWDNSGNTFSRLSSRAPIFYDSQNTARYFDGVSGLNMTTGTSSRVTIYTDDSGLHVANGEGAGGDIRIGAAYNRIGIYNNPSIHIQSETSIEFWTGNTQRGYFDNASNLFANSSMRSQLFYDSNDTGYFINPNGDSNLSKTFTYLGGRDTNGNWNTGFQNTPPASYNFHGDIASGGPAGTWWFYESRRHSNSNGYWGTQVAWGWEDNERRLLQRNVQNGTFSAWVEYLNTSGRTYSGNLTMTGSIISSASDVRAPIFYDQNNTGYYLDPSASTSLRTVGDWRSDSSGWTGEFNGKIQYHANNWYFQAANEWVFRRSDGQSAMWLMQAGNANFFGPISTINNVSPPNGAIRLTPNMHINAGAGSAVILNWDNGTTSGQTLRIGNGAGTDVFNVYANGYTYAPIYYDMNDTSAYVDPAGASFIKGGWQMMNPSASNDCFGGLELRENGLVAASQSSASYAPRVNFHWGSRAAATIYMDSGGQFVFGGQSDITNNRRSIFCADLYATGNVTAYYSDDRLKTRIGNIENALDIVSSLNGFRYVDNELAETFGYANNGTQLGVSAQEVQKHLPEIVRGAAFDVDHDDPDHGSKTGENYLTVDYSRMVPLLIEAIKELRHEVEMLKK